MSGKNILLIVLIAVAGGSIPPFAKLSLEVFDPFTLVFFRFLAATMIIYLFMPRQSVAFSRLRELKWVALIGALNPIFIFLALEHLPSNIIALFYALIPGMSVIYLLVVHQQRETYTHIAGFFVGLAGVITISLHTAVAENEGNAVLGLLPMSVAVISFFAYGIMSKEHQRDEKISGTELAFYLTAVTAVVSLPFATYESVVNPWLANLEIGPVVATLYLGFIGTGAQYLLYQKALKTMEAAQANIFIYLQPIVGFIFAALLVGEVITSQVLIGSIIVLIGASLALSKKRRH